VIQYAARKSSAHRTPFIASQVRTLPSIVLFILLLATSSFEIMGQEPVAKPPQILMVVPLGSIPGETLKLKARGLNLDTATDIKSNVPDVAVKFLAAGKTGVPASLNPQQAGDSQIEFEIAIPAGAGVDVVELTCVTPEGQATYQLPVRSGEKIILETEPNAGFNQAHTIELSQTVLGQIQSPQDVDVFTIELVEGTFVRIEVAAAEHGSALDSLLTLYDADGTQIARHDDRVPSRDSLIEWKVTKSGRYFVVVQDANDLGGEAQGYRLRVAPMT